MIKSKLIGKSDAPYTAFILHGYGSNYNDMSGLAEELLSSNSQLANKVKFLSLNAPHPWEGGMPNAYQWFSLNSRDEQSVYAGLQSCHSIIEQYISDYIASNNLTWDKIILSGFSQGAMISLHTSIRLHDKIAGVVCFSGTIIKRELVATEAKSKPPMCFIHGKQDEILPYQSSQLAHSQMQSIGVPSTLHLFDNLGHSIDHRCVHAAQKFLLSL